MPPDGSIKRRRPTSTAKRSRPTGRLMTNTIANNENSPLLTMTADIEYNGEMTANTGVIDQLFPRQRSRSSSGSASSGTSLIASAPPTDKQESATVPIRFRKQLSVAIWAAHFSFSLVAVMVGMLANGDERKYVPASFSMLEDVDEGEASAFCTRGFADVLAGSGGDMDARVCCDSVVDGSVWSLCRSSKSINLPFASRLARFPDAWLLPLFPLLLQLAYLSVRAGVQACSTRPIAAPLLSVSNALRRLIFYILLFLFRGIVLYVGLNILEETIGSSQDDDLGCWYQDVLRAKDQAGCYGRAFDFSDHVVLYFAQILPIALTECIYATINSSWPSDNRTVVADASLTLVQRSLRVLFASVLWCGMAYLYLITYLGLYKTAAYFHTAGEVFAGFVVSLLVQVPLCYLQTAPSAARFRACLGYQDCSSPVAMPLEKS